MPSLEIEEHINFDGVNFDTKRKCEKKLSLEIVPCSDTLAFSLVQIGTQSEQTRNWLPFLKPLQKKPLMYHPNLTVTINQNVTVFNGFFSKLSLKLGELSSIEQILGQNWGH